MADALEVATRAGVAVWTMRSAPVNAIATSMLTALDKALDAALDDEGVSVIVLASDLRVFSAGADASWMARTIDEVGPQELLERFNVMMDRFRAFCARLHRCRLLSVAAVDGHVLAGGLELAAACDLRYMADHPKIQVGVPEMKLFGAMPSGGGGVQFLTRLMGRSAALHFILSGEPVAPARARELGLVDALVTEGTAKDAAVSFALRSAQQAGPVGIEAVKTAIMRGWELPMAEALDFDRDVHWQSMRQGNFLHGVEAFARSFG
jgi:enoyl-CoA hydratase